MVIMCLAPHLPTFRKDNTFIGFIRTPLFTVFEHDPEENDNGSDSQ